MSEKTSKDSVFFQFFNEIGIINQLSSAVFTKALPDNLKISQFSVLNHFVRLGDGKTPLQLSKAFQVTKGAMSNTLKRLQDRELITIESDPKDGRSKRVFITEKGRKMRTTCIESLNPFIEQLKPNFSESELKNVLPILQKIRKFLDEERG